MAALIAGCYLYFQAPPFMDSEYSAIKPLATHASGDHYVGSESCKKCHADIYDSHLETAHYLSSKVADTGFVKGSFKKTRNRYSLNDSIAFKMVLESDTLYQQTWDTHSQEKISQAKIDVVVGSGTKGQTYLSWEKDQLYQLQISYFTPTDSWTNSPGVPMELMEQPRPVNAKCLECHSTYAKSTDLYGMGNSYERSQIILGIDCERCHGPAEKHVAFHTKHPEAPTAQYMIVHDTLTRQQRLDACALCHSGVRMDIQPAFLFRTGDRLREFSLADPNARLLEQVDVHGNQYDLLRASSCFQQSPTMDCSTCHDVHQKERGNALAFNAKCMACHTMNTTVCSVEATLSSQKDNDCITCHMPLTPSKSMFMQIGRDSIKIPVKVRTHLIDRYTESIMDTGS